MADRYPLIVNSSTSKIQELPAGGNLDLHNNGIVNETLTFDEKNGLLN